MENSLDSFMFDVLMKTKFIYIWSKSKNEIYNHPTFFREKNLIYLILELL